MTRDIFLYGRAGELFGRHFRLAVDSPAEAVRALFMLRPGFREFMRANAWRVIVGRPHIANGIPAEALQMRLGEQALHIVPATNPAGGDGKSIGMIIVGVIIIGAAIILSGGTLAAPLAGMGLAAFSVGGMGVTFGTIALLGVSMVLAGVSGLLAARPEVAGEAESPEERARPEDRPSFMFNGVTNNSQQGGPVPVVCGRHLVGSVVVSGGIAVEDIPV